MPWTTPAVVSPGPATYGRPVSYPAAGGRRRTAFLLGGIAAAVLVVAVVVSIAVRIGSGDRTAASNPPAAQQPATSDPAAAADGGAAIDTTTPDDTATTPEQSPSTEAADAERAALDELTRIRQQDLPQVHFTGQYAAQLASKNPGISDAYQTAADGTHTFRATDILAEHRQLVDQVGGAAQVVLLESTDYGKRQRYNGQPLWVTFALDDFADRQDVLNWCAQQFSNLSGDALGDQCAVRRLEP